MAWRSSDVYLRLNDLLQGPFHVCSLLLELLEGVRTFTSLSIGGLGGANEWAHNIRDGGTATVIYRHTITTAGSMLAQIRIALSAL